MPQVVLLARDLTLASRLQAAAAAAGLSVTLVNEPSQLASQLGPECRLVLLDLAEAGFAPAAVVPQVRAQAPAARVLAFGPHVQEATLGSARAAGCDLVLSRGQFHRQLADLLRSCLADRE